MKVKSSVLCALVTISIAASHFAGAALAAETVPAASFEGILVAKGPNWVEVKADGNEKAVRYRPRWIGKMPKDGGGLDAAVLKSFGSLVVPNRVGMRWENLEGPRVLSITMLTPPTKAGRSTGLVTAKGESWIEIKVGDKIERYSPRWIGKMPKDGGGLDRPMLAAIAATKVGDKVVFEWIFDERKRVVMLRPPV